MKAHYCAQCGYRAAAVPVICVLNLETGSQDQIKLQLPPLCDSCLRSRGMARFNLLVPKLDELHCASEMLEAHKQNVEEWTRKSLKRAADDLIDMGMTKKSVKDMLGLD